MTLSALIVAVSLPGPAGPLAQQQPASAQSGSVQAPAAASAPEGPSAQAPANTNAGASSQPTTVPNGATTPTQPNASRLNDLQRPLALPFFDPEVTRSADRLALELSRLQRAAVRLEGDSEGLAALRGDAERLQGAVQQSIARLRPLLPEVRQQLDRLGEPPAQSAAPELSSVTEERAQLQALQRQIDGAIRRLDLTDTRTSQLLGRLQLARHSLLARDLLSQSPSPLSPALWAELASVSDRIGRQVGRVAELFARQVSDRSVPVLGLLAVAALVYALALQLRAMIVRQQVALAVGDGGPVGFFRRSWLATVLAPAFALPRLLALGVIALGIHLLNLSNTLTEGILLAIATALITYIVTSALARAVLLRRQPTLRLLDVDEVGAVRLARLVRLMAIVFGLDLIVTATISSLYLPLVVGNVSGALANLCFAALLIAFIQTPVVGEDREAGGDEGLSWLFVKLRLPVVLTGLAIAAVTLAGYIVLGRFIAMQVLLIGTGGLAAFLVHQGVTSAISGQDEPAAGRSSSGSTAAASLQPRASSELSAIEETNLIPSLVKLALNAMLGLLVVTALLLSWGFSTGDIASWLRALVVGFEIGEIRVSPAQIMLALALFAALLAVTRVMQRWLSANVLTTKRMDQGLAHSIHTGVGYAGTGLAALAAISYAGLDITNLAIVAGALSVGIGFGLQSIVNNFVSGLILLVERPIKVGDWIVVGAHEGYVRRISVRSTEIETFDRASLILPNSELITGTVQNWTHRNSMGRIIVAVGASYDSDPELVVSTLRQAAANCPALLKYPAPFVAFDAFGDSALEFSVRAFVSDVNTSLSARTELRVAILQAFREAGLEIPFPQQDLHLRDLDGIKAAFAKAAASRDLSPEQLAERLGSMAAGRRDAAE
ncbi:MAG: DUF3772 domain-containing protein [Hyphomicrobiaceae bacterium]